MNIARIGYGGIGKAIGASAEEAVDLIFRFSTKTDSWGD